MTAKETLISVIIPIYNIAPYLPRCLDSIVGQTYKNLEIILVDDGSTDNSLEICQQYADKDSRMRVIHQKNQGLAAARNTGLDNAHGEFITFVDSDDWISPTYHEQLLTRQQQTQADMVSCSYYRVFDTHKKDHPFIHKETPEILSPAELTLLFLEQRNFNAWNKIYRRGWIGETRFNPKCKIAEDLDFTFQLARKGGKVTHLHKSLYFYYQRSDSLVRTTDSQKWYGVFQIILKLKQDFSAIPSPRLQTAIDERLIACASVFGMAALLNGQGNTEKVQQVRALLKKHIRQIPTITSINTGGKLFALLFIFCPHIINWSFNLPGINARLKKAFSAHMTN